MHSIKAPADVPSGSSDGQHEVEIASPPQSQMASTSSGGDRPNKFAYRMSRPTDCQSEWDDTEYEYGTRNPQNEMEGIEIHDNEPSDMDKELNELGVGQDGVRDMDVSSNVGSDRSAFDYEGNASSDVQWASLIENIPKLSGNNMSLEYGDKPVHTSFVSQSFQKQKSETATPKLPLEGVVKQVWDDVDKQLRAGGKITAYRASDNRKFRIHQEDFDKYGFPGAIDQEYRAKLEVDDKKHTQPMGRPMAKSPLIKNPLLRFTEIDLMKGDDSARLIFRAASHGTLMLNALNNLVQEQNIQVDGFSDMVQGIHQSMQTMADCAARISARSTFARRRIFLSQIKFNDQNAYQELMRLPMDGKSLFHGELSNIMHKYASMSRDAKETGDYASSTIGTRKRPYGQDSQQMGPNKKKRPTSGFGQKVISNYQQPRQVHNQRVTIQNTKARNESGAKNYGSSSFRGGFRSGYSGGNKFPQKSDYQ